jgi:hypothetical protein
MIGTCARYREAFAGVKKLADAPDFGVRSHRFQKIASRFNS